MDRPTITRRRALAMGAAAGLGTLLSRSPAAALGARRGAARGFALTVSPGDFDGGHVSRVLRAPRRFDLLGLRGSGRVEVRVRRRGGAWSRWVALAAHGDHAPDTGSGERASDPVWSGGSHELQLRTARAPRAPLRLHLVAVPAPARRRATAHARAGGPRQAPAPGTPPAIIPRAAWGADSVPPRAAPSYGEVQLAFVHHTVTINEYAPQDSAAIVLGIAKYHRDVNGWNDIGYNFLVDRFGQVFEGRAGGVDRPVVGAQAQGYNRVSTGIAHLGTYSDVPTGEPALAVTAQLLGWKLSLHGVPTEGAVTVTSNGGSANRYRAGTPVTLQRISGHRDGDTTACPGNALYAQLPELRRRASAMAGPVASPAVQVTLTAVRAVVYGDAASFSGAVTRPDGTAGAGEAVALQKRGATGAWVTIARATAAADGTWSAAAPWRQAGDVRAFAAGAASPVASVDVLPRVEQATRTRRVLAGSAITLAGRVRPASPVGVLVEVQGSDGRWRRVRVVRARVRLTAWSTTVRLRRPGLYRFTPRTTARGGVVAAPALYVRARRPRARQRTGGVLGR